MRGRPALSPWIDGRTRPQLPGVYQRHTQRHSAGSAAVLYARWNGRRWFAARADRQEAAMVTELSLYPNLPWRGLRDKR